MTTDDILKLKNKHDSLVYRRLYNRLVLTAWRHYKGGEYYVFNVVWDATQDEWAVQYGRRANADEHLPMTYVRTLSDWFAFPFASDPTVIRFREIK